MKPQSDSPNPGLVIFGGWFYSKVVAESARLSGWNVLGFVDPDPPAGTPSLSRIPDGASVIVAVGDNHVRATIQDRLEQADRRLVTIAHPSAIISPSATIGAGCHFGENAVIRANAHVGRGTFLNSGSVVSHDCRVGEFVTFGPNAATGGYVTIGDRALVGVGANVRPNCTLSSDCVIGPGAAVLRDVAAHKTVIGNPARPVAKSKAPVKQSNWDDNPVW